MFRIVLFLILGLTVFPLCAMTPSELAPQMPSSAKYVFSFKPADYLKQHRKLRPKEADGIAADYAKVNLNINDFNQIYRFGDERYFAELLSTNLTFTQLATAIATTPKIQRATRKIKGTDVTVFIRTDSPAYQLCLHQLRTGLFLVAQQESFEWVMNSPKMNARSPLSVTIPAPTTRSTAWMAVIPFDGMLGKPETAKKIPITFEKIDYFGATFDDADPQFLMRARVVCRDSQVAHSFKNALQLIVMGVAFSFDDPSLTDGVRKALTLRTSGRSCGIAIRADEALIINTYHTLYQRFSPTPKPTAKPPSRDPIPPFTPES